MITFLTITFIITPHGGVREAKMIIKKTGGGVKVKRQAQKKRSYFSGESGSKKVCINIRNISKGMKESYTYEILTCTGNLDKRAPFVLLPDFFSMTK